MARRKASVDRARPVARETQSFTTARVDWLLHAGSADGVLHSRAIGRAFSELKRCNLGVFAGRRAEQNPLDLTGGASA